MQFFACELWFFLIALQFFIRISVIGWLADWVGWSPEAMHASARHYPAVGLLVGVFSVALLWGATQLWPLLESACRILAEMASFESAGVSNKATHQGA